MPGKITISKSAKIVRYISIGLFVISLAFPCFDTEKQADQTGQGGQLLLMGLLWFMYAWPGIVWLANPLLLLSWIAIGKKRDRAFITSIIAVLLALCFLFLKEMLIDESGSNYTPITEHRIGYWLWLLSMLAMVFGNLYLQLTTKPKPLANTMLPRV